MWALCNTPSSDQGTKESLIHSISSASLLVIILGIKRPIRMKSEHKEVLFLLPLQLAAPYSAAANPACSRREACNGESIFHCN